jgi:hypothetical protein
VTSTAAPGWWIVGALVVFTHCHAVAIFIIGGVFNRTGPEVVQYDCDSILSEGSPCISVFDLETYTQHFQRRLRGNSLCKIPFLPRAI